MKKTSRPIICFGVAMALLLSFMTAASAEAAPDKIILGVGMAAYELTVAGSGSYVFTLPTSAAADSSGGKIKSVPNPDGLSVVVTVGGTDYALNGAAAFPVAEGTQIAVKVGGASGQVYTLNIQLSVYEEIKALVKAINTAVRAGKPEGMVNGLKARYTALPGWAKDLVTNRDELGYPEAPGKAAALEGKIVLDGGRTVYEIELEDGVLEYTQPVASSYADISVSAVPHEQGDAVALQVGGQAYALGAKFPLSDVTEVVITVSGDGGVIAYKVTVLLSVDEEIKALNAGIAVLASMDIDLRFKGMVLPLLERYNALGDEAKKRVVDAQALLDAKATIDRLEKEAADVAAAAAKAVKDLNGGIAALRGRRITLADEENIQKMLQAYDLLTAGQKAQIADYAVLTQAAAALDALKADPNPETGEDGRYPAWILTCAALLPAAVWVGRRGKKARAI